MVRTAQLTDEPPYSSMSANTTTATRLRSKIETHTYELYDRCVKSLQDSDNLTDENIMTLLTAYFTIINGKLYTTFL